MSTGRKEDLLVWLLTTNSTEIKKENKTALVSLSQKEVAYLLISHQQNLNLPHMTKKKKKKQEFKQLIKITNYNKILHTLIWF